MLLYKGSTIKAFSEFQFAEKLKDGTHHGCRPFQSSGLDKVTTLSTCAHLGNRSKAWAFCRLKPFSFSRATIARDVALLKEKGFSLRTAQAADLFPRCSHVETVVLLTRTHECRNG